MLKRAAIAVEADEAKALGAFSRGEGGFRTADSYVFCVGPDGVMSAHSNPILRGHDVRSLHDKAGHYVIKDMLKQAKPGEVSMASAAARADEPAAAPKLVRLIAKHDHINAMLNASGDESGVHDPPGLIRAAGALRARVLGFPSRSLPDILAKAACMARLYPLADLGEELNSKAASGHADIDEGALGIALDLMKLGEGSLCT
jgi:hypothetical protein